MKKLYFLLLILFCIPIQIFAINGDGSFGSPYNGPLTANMNWSGTVYVNGDITVNGYTLTISQGSVIIFLTSGTDIIITGTGVLTASGGPGVNIIRFTADYDNDGNYGETGERWGHISFQNMSAGFTGASLLNYCIVEFGQKGSTPFNFESAGGGIHTTYSYLTISNSIVKNNYAGWGGGIYVNANASPSILNCTITNNVAGTTGGGLSIYHHSSSVVENCIIVKNTCNGAGGGGGIFVGDYPDNVRFFNCTIASNLSYPTNSGNNIRIWQTAPSTGPQFFNTIVWGSANSINYLGLGRKVTDFNYCAIQGYTSGYTNCINLNSSNNNPAGPNFNSVTSGSEDYQIAYISPCRDLGTSAGAPATDFLGNSRIGPYDIGAYEVQYSRWTGGGTEWGSASNWAQNLAPGPVSDIIIPSGLTFYPTDEPGPYVTVGAGKYLVLEPGAKATLSTISNSGTLWLMSNTTNMFSLKIDSYSNNGGAGTEKIELYLSGSTTTNLWHYISSPVQSLPVTTFTSTTLDLVQYVESMPTFDNEGLLAGWIGFDGFNYADQGNPMPAYAFNSLTSGQGYNYYYKSNYKYSFPGILNTNDVAVILGYSGFPFLSGFNLLGNPFSSGLDWDQIVNSTYFPYPANTSKGLYFTRNNGQCSYIAGVGIPADVTGIIAPMQGFFVKTNSSGNTIALPAGARTNNNIHPRYKGTAIIPLIRLSIVEAAVSDETVVRFDDQAKSYLDNDFDAVKMFVSETATTIYSSLADTKYAINGLPFPETFVEIPIVVNIVNSGNHSITATQLQGLENYPVTLMDKTTGFTADLKTTPALTFSASAGSLTDRFILKVGNIATGTEDPVSSVNIFNIYPSFGAVNIQTISDEWNGKTGSVKIHDLSGKIVKNLDNTNFSKNSLITVPINAVKGIYVVEIKAGVKRFVGKVVIR